LLPASSNLPALISRGPLLRSDFPERSIQLWSRSGRRYLCNPGTETSHLSQTRYEVGRAVLTTALELLDRPHDLYNTATDHARKLLNKTIFTRLYLNIDGPEHQPTVTTDDLNEPFTSLIHTARTKNLTQPTQNVPHDRLSSFLTTALAGQAAMVERAC
jgi:hypothetical protein